VELLKEWVWKTLGSGFLNMFITSWIYDLFQL